MELKYDAVAAIVVLVAFALSLFVRGDAGLGRMGTAFSILGLLLIASMSAAFILRKHRLGKTAFYFFFAVLAQGILAMFSMFLVAALFALKLLPLELAFPASYFVLLITGLLVPKIPIPKIEGVLAIIGVIFLFTGMFIAGDLGIAVTGLSALFFSPVMLVVFNEKIPEEVERR